MLTRLTPGKTGQSTHLCQAPWTVTDWSSANVVRNALQSTGAADHAMGKWESNRRSGPPSAAKAKCSR